MFKTSLKAASVKCDTSRRVTKGGRGVSLPCNFLKIGKSALIWGKMPWLLSSMGKMSHLKYNFLEFQAKKLRFFPCGALLSLVVDK